LHHLGTMLLLLLKISMIALAVAGAIAFGTVLRGKNNKNRPVKISRKTGVRPREVKQSVDRIVAEKRRGK